MMAENEPRKAREYERPMLGTSSSMALTSTRGGETLDAAGGDPHPQATHRDAPATATHTAQRRRAA